MATNYLDVTAELYKDVASTPDVGLCCTTTPVWQLPGLKMPDKMIEMNYGCGTTVHPKDLINEPKVLYVGVGGGMEILQFSYFSRKPKHIIGIDRVPEMIDACKSNLTIAEDENDWFSADFVELMEGDAMNLPVEDESVDVTAQNCLFNIFKSDDLDKAIAETYRVLKPYGRFVTSDPICEQEMPDNLKADERLRAMCLSGAIPLDAYIKKLTDAGFGTVEVRARRPYRMLDPKHYDTQEPIFIESVEVCAIKDPMPLDGPCVFTGKAAIYTGDEGYFDDKRGHVLMQNMPSAICDKTAIALQGLGNPDIFVTGSTYFYDGGGCC